MARLTTLLFAMWLGVTVSTEVDLEKRILGGHECGAKERLYHVQLIYTDTKKFFCGGSLISKQWILTAAHCFVKGREFTAYIGSNPGPLEIGDIKEKPVIFIDLDGKQHDLMLLKLPEKVKGIIPVQLPDCTDRPKVKTTVQIAGHAATTVGHDNKMLDATSPTLQCAYIDITDCKDLKGYLLKEYKEYHQANKHMQWICASSPKVDICSGDSGGGMVYNNRIYGVNKLSHATDACAVPAGFMDLCHQPYLDWINDTIKDTILDTFKDALMDTVKKSRANAASG